MVKRKAEIWLERVKKSVVEGRTKNFWIKVKRKKDFFDVLIGKKNGKPHVHFGINPDASTKFIQDRGKVRTIKREHISLDGKKVLLEEQKFFDEEAELSVSFDYKIRKIVKNGFYTSIEKITISERTSV